MRTSPAGWYPQEDGRLRYWDGQSWTEHAVTSGPGAGGVVGWAASAASAEQPAQAAPVRQPRPWFRKKRVLVPAGLLLLVVIGSAMDGGTTGDTSSAVPAAATASGARPTASTTTDAATTAKLEADARAASAAQAKADAEAKARAAAEARAKAAAQARARAAAEAKAQAVAAAKRNPKSYKAISARSFAKLVKNPDAHIGEKYVIHGHVRQFDSATGADTFLADTAAVRAAEWYDYDTNTLVTAETASLFADVVEDDLVTLYVEVLGSFSYDTQIGGNTTVPHLRAHIVKVTGSTG